MKIVYYHRVADIENDFNKLAITPTLFEEHILYYKDNYNIVSMDEWKSKEKEKENLIITFDDGYEDMYTNLLPIVERNRIPITIYISTGKIGVDKEMWCDDILRYILSEKSCPDFFCLEHEIYGYKFDTSTIEKRVQLYYSIRFIMQRLQDNEREEILEQLSQWSGIEKIIRNDRKILSKEQIVKLSQSPYVTIGAHTINHPSLARYNYSEQKYEIEQSKLELEQMIGKKITHFSYPFGTKADFDKNSIKILKENCFLSAVTTMKEVVEEDDVEYKLPRWYIGNWNIQQLHNYLHNIQNNIQTEENNKIEYIGKLLTDSLLFDADFPIIIFGTGKKALDLFITLKKYGISNRVVAYADNNDSKQGIKIDGIPVINPNKIKEWNDPRIIIGSMYDKEIIKQLHDLNNNNIHIII